MRRGTKKAVIFSKLLEKVWFWLNFLVPSEKVNLIKIFKVLNTTYSYYNSVGSQKNNEK